MARRCIALSHLQPCLFGAICPPPATIDTEYINPAQNNGTTELAGHPGALSCLELAHGILRGMLTASHAPTHASSRHAVRRDKLSPTPPDCKLFGIAADGKVAWPAD